MVKKADNPKKLYRSSKNNWLGGVCGGIGEYFEVDPNIVRIVWIALTLASLGFGLLLYIAAWLIIPLNTEQSK
ncbi:MAG: PspC domain-containing protein [Candidatus Diapherotrites archaeon]|nr:PspC domain-containing protein [Candidatus Diapherotrites archaeon]